MNHVNLIGNVTKDLELKQYKNGEVEGEYVQFTLAINEINPKSKEKVTNFIDVVAFDKRAQVLSQYVGKGSKLAIEGKITVGSYINEEGKNNKRVSIIVTNFTFVDNKKVVNGEGFISRDEIPF